jgi:hypothetical protein
MPDLFGEADKAMTHDEANDENGFKQFGKQRNHQSDAWLGQQFLVVPFDNRMEPEMEQLARVLEADGYYGFTVSKRNLYLKLLVEGDHE